MLYTAREHSDKWDFGLVIGTRYYDCFNQMFECRTIEPICSYVQFAVVTASQSAHNSW